MVWSPEGLLAQWGVLDFAGGIVVHNSAGLAALASVLYVGKRKDRDTTPHSIPLVALGTGLLWFGWYGFNAGSEFQVDSVTTSAFINTDFSASFAGRHLAGAGVGERQAAQVRGPAHRRRGRPGDRHPRRRLRLPRTAVLIGVTAGVVCYYAVALKNRLGWDDALDVWGVHGVGGFLGIVCLGLFANKAWNPHVVTNGLFFGGGFGSWASRWRR